MNFREQTRLQAEKGHCLDKFGGKQSQKKRFAFITEISVIMAEK